MKEKTALYFLLILFAITIFGHESAEIPFEWFVSNFGNGLLKNIFNITFSVLTLGMLIFFYKRLQTHPKKRILILYTFITLIFSIIGYKYLMPYKSEGIHFLQYGLLGFVCMMWTPNVWFSLNMVSFLGIFDEIYQYIYSNSAYLDFNDMVLNFFGVALGVILFKISYPGAKKYISSPLKHLGYLLQLLFIVLLMLLISTDIICIYGGEGCGRSIISQIKGAWTEDFFDSTDFGPDWHRIKPYEGMLYVILMPILYYPIGKKLDYAR